MTTYDLSPLYRSAIGVDRFARLLNDAQRAENAVSYPPYNIEQLSEDAYRIVMAVAGFCLDELDIETEQQTLKVAGRKPQMSEKEEVTYLHRGIAARDFMHTFQMAEHVKVVNASLENGLLTISLEREVPEVMKPRKIAINTKAANSVNQITEKKAA